MNLAERKVMLIEIIARLRDVDVLTEIENLLKDKEINTQVYQKIQHSEQSVAQGKTFSHEEVEQHFDKKRWQK